MSDAQARLMVEQPDPLVEELLKDFGVPERVNYAAGVLLDDQDFLSEQSYLRGRLARALAALYGFGTIAGLAVSCDADDNPERELQVAAGLALDRLGRLIEVRRTQCLRLVRWFTHEATREESRRAELLAARVDDAGHPGKQQMFLDVSLRFAICPHGKTPAFAAGPFNSTDHVVASRLADAFELTLDLAPLAEDRTPLAPHSSLPPLDEKLAELASLPAEERAAMRRRWAVDAALAAWPSPDPTDPTRLPKLKEQRHAADWLNVLLARVAVPITQDDDDAPPQVDPTRAVEVDNHLRPVVFNPLRWHGA